MLAYVPQDATVRSGELHSKAASEVQTHKLQFSTKRDGTALFKNPAHSCVWAARRDCTFGGIAEQGGVRSYKQKLRIRKNLITFY